MIIAVEKQSKVEGRIENGKGIFIDIVIEIDIDIDVYYRYMVYGTLSVQFDGNNIELYKG